ncbi:MAG: cysteine desulfurase [Bacteroidota bacterium]
MIAQPLMKGSPPQVSPFDVERLRRDFPILRTAVRGKPLIYLDNAATTQKPQVMIDALRRYYEAQNANIHRGVHYLSELGTKLYEDARLKAKDFIRADDWREVIFVKGTTEAINLVASTYGRSRVNEGDEIVISGMEHHSNIVPWQMLCGEKNAKLRVIPLNDAGELLLNEYERLLTPTTRLVAVAHVSNALGTINPLSQMIAMAHAKGIPVLVDGAQAVPHMKVDVRELDCDFYAFSAHKMYGPTGIGILYGKSSFLQDMPPYQGGGDMIKSVTFEKTLFNDLPYKFEAGTPNIADTIAFGATLDYLQSLDWTTLTQYEHDLLTYATEQLAEIRGLKVIGTAREKAGVLSFTLENIHPHDIGTILDQEGIAVRTGHHCAQPVMIRYDIPATVRASFAFYNTREEVDALVRGIHKVVEVFA